MNLLMDFVQFHRHLSNELRKLSELLIGFNVIPTGAIFFAN